MLHFTKSFSPTAHIKSSIRDILINEAIKKHLQAQVLFSWVLLLGKLFVKGFHDSLGKGGMAAAVGMQAGAVACVHDAVFSGNAGILAKNLVGVPWISVVCATVTWWKTSRCAISTHERVHRACLPGKDTD